MNVEIINILLDKGIHIAIVLLIFPIFHIILNFENI